MSRDLATVTVTIRDDPANENGVNVVIESDPPYPLTDGNVDPDRVTNAQAVAYVVAEELARIVPGLEFSTLIAPDVPDTPRDLDAEGWTPRNLDDLDDQIP